jgi:hypothetical protein
MQKPASDISVGLGGSVMFIRDSVDIEPQHDEAIIDFWSFGLANLIQTKAKHHQASRLTILEL